jgi:hypothetical protein
VNAYEATQERRRARLERAAERARAESDAAFQASRDAVAGIPFGQPILVGHHSEKRHRGALAKSDARLRKACDRAKEADELERRAASVGSAGISSDDPEAVEKLTDKRTDLERKRDQMKAANAAWKKQDDAGLIAATGKGLAAWAPVIEAAYSWEKQPFPAWSLSNVGARIRAAAKRVEVIEETRAVEASRDELAGGVVLTIDPDDNRVTLVFPARLSTEHYKLMRSAGFLWSPTRGGFTRKLGNSAEWHARRLAGLIGGGE